jgi:hypothetical protein
LCDAASITATGFIYSISVLVFLGGYHISLPAIHDLFKIRVVKAQSSCMYMYSKAARIIQVLQHRLHQCACMYSH